jgi:hypothetical protein
MRDEEQCNFDQFGHLSTGCIFQVVSNCCAGRTIENIMMNCQDCGELFGLDESSPDITNVMGTWALCVHVNPTFNPHSDVCSN